MGQLESAQFLGEGAGKGTLLVAKELAFEKAGGNGSAVHFDEAALLTAAQFMNRPGNQFLTRARLAQNEHSGSVCETI